MKRNLLPARYYLLALPVACALALVPLPTAYSEARAEGVMLTVPATWELEPFARNKIAVQAVVINEGPLLTTATDMDTGSASWTVKRVVAEPKNVLHIDKDVVKPALVEFSANARGEMGTTFVSLKPSISIGPGGVTLNIEAGNAPAVSATSDISQPAGLRFPANPQLAQDGFVSSWDVDATPFRDTFANGDVVTISGRVDVSAAFGIGLPGVDVSFADSLLRYNARLVNKDAGSVSFWVVPIPAAIWLFSVALLGLAGIVRRPWRSLSSVQKSINRPLQNNFEPIERRSNLTAWRCSP